MFNKNRLCSKTCGKVQREREMKKNEKSNRNVPNERKKI